MIYVGIDPSYTKTGVSYIDIDKKTIYFNAISPPGRNETYNNALQRAIHISKEIFDLTPEIRDKQKTIMLEEPLITSQMSSRLGILSGVIGTYITTYCETVGTQAFSLNPNAVSNTNRRVKGYTSRTRKRISKEMALKYLDVFIKYGYTYTIHNYRTNKDGSMTKRQLSTDEAESFIMLIILLRHLDLIDKDINEELIKINRGLNTDMTIQEIQGEING